MNFLSLYNYVKLATNKETILCTAQWSHTHAADSSPAVANQHAAFDSLSVSLLVPTRLVFFPQSRWNTYGTQWPTPLVLLLKS